jgi:hypothetical protein
LGLEAKFVINGIAQSLLAPEIALRGLHADVPEQELDLVEFAAGQVAQTGARAAEIVGRNIHQSAAGRSSLDHAPDNLGAEAIRRYPTRLVNGAEHGPLRQAGFCQPDVNGVGDPVRYRNRSNVTAFPDQIGKDPVVFALLKILNLNASQLGAPQATPEEDGYHGVVSLAAKGGSVEAREESPTLLYCEPIPDTSSVLLGTFDAAYAGGEVRAE